MNGKELVQTMIRLFFPIWGVLFFGLMTLLLVLGYTELGFIDTVVLAIIALFVTLSIVVHYSKKDLSKSQMIARYVIHSLIVLMILIVSAFFGWPYFQWRYLLLIVPLHFVGYCIVVAIEERYSKRLLSKFKEASK